MVQSIKTLGDSSNLTLDIRQYFGATYKYVSDECTPNPASMSVNIVMHLEKIANSPTFFSYDYEKELDPIFRGANIMVVIKFLDEKGKDVTHQETADNIERAYGK